MKHLLYILCALACGIVTFASCSSDIDDGQPSYGTLDLTLSRGPLPSVVQRSVAEGLAVQLVRPDQSVYAEYAAGEVPDKITLEAGVTYTLRAYSENQSSWQTANGGKGEACYFGTTTVSVGADETVRVNYAVPMTNYAVTLTLPELFNDFFKSYTFVLTSGDRSVTVREGEKAYFAVPQSFSYRLTATNTDDKTSQHSILEVSDVAAGKLYNIHYIYATDATTGGIDIEITDNSEHENVDIKI